MTAGNVAHRGNHDANRQAMGQRDSQKAGAASAVEILIGADRAGAEERRGESNKEGFEN